MKKLIKVLVFSCLLGTVYRQEARPLQGHCVPSSSYAIAAGAVAVGAWGLWRYFSESDEALLKRVESFAQTYSKTNVFSQSFPYAALGVQPNEAFYDEHVADQYCNEDYFNRCLQELGCHNNSFLLLSARGYCKPWPDRSLVTKVEKRIKKLARRLVSNPDPEKGIILDNMKRALTCIALHEKRHDFEYDYSWQLQQYCNAHKKIAHYHNLFDSQIKGVSGSLNSFDVNLLKRRILSSYDTPTEPFPYVGFMTKLIESLASIESLKGTYDADDYPVLHAKIQELYAQLACIRDALAVDSDYRHEVIRHEEMRREQERYQQLLQEQKNQARLQERRNAIEQERNTIEYTRLWSDIFSNRNKPNVTIYC